VVYYWCVNVWGFDFTIRAIDKVSKTF
jgi:hypothetical protein